MLVVATVLTGVWFLYGNRPETRPADDDQAGWFLDESRGAAKIVALSDRVTSRTALVLLSGEKSFCTPPPPTLRRWSVDSALRRRRAFSPAPIDLVSMERMIFHYGREFPVAAITLPELVVCVTSSIVQNHASTEMNSVGSRRISSLHPVVQNHASTGTSPVGGCPSRSPLTPGPSPARGEGRFYDDGCRVHRSVN